MGHSFGGCTAVSSVFKEESEHPVEDSDGHHDDIALAIRYPLNLLYLAFLKWLSFSLDGWFHPLDGSLQGSYDKIYRICRHPILFIVAENWRPDDNTEFNKNFARTSLLHKLYPHQWTSLTLLGTGHHNW